MHCIVCATTARRSAQESGACWSCLSLAFRRLFLAQKTRCSTLSQSMYSIRLAKLTVSCSARTSQMALNTWSLEERSGQRCGSSLSGNSGRQTFVSLCPLRSANRNCDHVAAGRHHFSKLTQFSNWGLQFFLFICYKQSHREQSVAVGRICVNLSRRPGI